MRMGVVCLSIWFLAAALGAAAPLGTAFTYQGQLRDGGAAANGLYDLQFSLYDGPTGGGSLSGPITQTGTSLSNGTFTVFLDFGSGMFDGSARWLEIGVRPNGSAGGFTTLTPRQPVTATPYALYSPSAGTAASVPAAGLTGTLSDARLSTNVALQNRSATFAGTLKATGFSGNAGGLTNLNAASLTGPLALQIGTKLTQILRDGTNNSVTAVTVAGRYAYLACGVRGLRIYDVANPAQPVLLCFTNWNLLVMDVAVAGNYAYLACHSGGLRIFDISTPTTPVQVGGINNGGQALKVAVSDAYAYLANDSDGLRIYDVSNPANPVNVAHLTASNSIGQVAVAGHYAYLGMGVGGIGIYDITTPANPVLAGQIAAEVDCFTIAGTYAYVGVVTVGLAIYDLADPVHPVRLSQEYNHVFFRGLAVSSHYVCAAAFNSGLYIYDVADKTNPVVVQQNRDSTGMRTPAAAGNYVYVATDADGLLIYALEAFNAVAFRGDGLGLTNIIADNLVGTLADARLSPNVVLQSGSPTFSGRVAATAFSGNGAGLTNLDANQLSGALGVAHGVGVSQTNDASGVSGVAVTSNNAFLVCLAHDLRVYDLANPDSPILVGQTNTGGSPVEVAISGSHAYVADTMNGLLVYDLSNPANPVLVARTNQGGIARGVAVSGNFVFLANDYDGVRIYDVSNPANPVGVCHLTSSPQAKGVTVAGNYAYVANYAEGFHIYEVSNPAAPILVKVLTETVLGGGYAQNATIAGRYAYLANGSWGLSIFDITDPQNPTFISRCPGVMGSSATSVRIAGRYACLANGSDGLRLYDISNPASPLDLGHLDTGGLAERVAIAGNVAYVADTMRGLRLVLLETVTAPAFQGDGSGMTNLNAAGMTLGTLSDARLSHNVARLDANQTFTGINAFAGPGYYQGSNRFDNPANWFAGSFAGNGAGLTNVDASALTGPLYVSSGLNLSKITNGGLSGVFSVAVAGTYLYSANGEDGLRVFNLANPSQPVLVGGTNDGGYAVSVTIVSNRLYVAETLHGLHIYDISTPTNPVSLAATNNGGWAQNSTVVGHYAYLAADGDGLRIYDISNPVNPVNVGHANDGGLARQVVVVGNYAYLASVNSGLRIYDVSNPANPMSVRLLNSSSTMAVAAAGRYLCYATVNGWVCIADISDPLNVLPVSYVNTGKTPSALAMTERYLCLGLSFEGMLIYDLSNPANPIQVATTKDYGYAQNITIAGNNAILANGADGIRIYALQVANAPVYQGSGFGLTDIPTTSLNGTLTDRQLSANVALLSANQTFSGINNLTNAANTVAGVFVGSFSGNGASLTNLNASTLASGTLVEARLSTNVTLLNGNQTFSGINRLTNTANAMSGAFTGGFSGNAAGLTNVNAANVVGTLADARLSTNVALLNANQTFAGVNQLTNAANTLAGSFTGSFSGNAGSLTNLNASTVASGTLAEARLSTNVTLLNANQAFSGVNQLTNAANSLAGTFTGAFNGNASGLTNVIGTNVIGTLPDARLSANVALLNANQAFAGANTLTNAANTLAGTFTGSFTGNAGSLTNLNASTLASGTVADARLSANIPRLNANQSFTGTVSFYPVGAPFAVGSSTLVANLNADQLDGLNATAFWQLGGNSNSTVGVNFLGTTDNQPLEFKVNNQRAVRFEPGAGGMPNLIAGASNNSVLLAVSGSTIAGGANNTIQGSTVHSSISGGISNVVQSSASFGAIGGGMGNVISGLSLGATIPGGQSNTAGGFCAIAMGNASIANGYVATAMGNSTTSTANYATAMGMGTTASGGAATAMGMNTIASGFGATAVGGNTIANGGYSVAMGYGSVASNAYGFALGYHALSLHNGSFVWADATGADFPSTAFNQFLIRASGGVGIGITNPVSALHVAGIVTADAFRGNGANLTNVSAGNLASGTLADTRLSTNVALLNANQTFSGVNTLSNVANSLAGTFTGNFNGNAGGATNLNATNLVGILPDARHSANIPRLNTNQTFTGTAAFAPASGAPFTVGNSILVTNLNADLLDGLNSGAFASNIHNHAGTDITTGTLADSRLSANVALLNAGQTFTAPLTVSTNVKVSGLIRLGTETNTTDAPYPQGLVIRRINSLAIQVSNVVARSDYLTLQRDGTYGGLVIRYPAGCPAQTITCMGMSDQGVAVNFYAGWTTNPAVAGVLQLCTDAQNAVHIQCTFGNTYNAGHVTQVNISRNGSDNFWIGTVTSTYNQ